MLVHLMALSCVCYHSQMPFHFSSFPLEFVHHIVPAKKNPPAGATVTVSGWGTHRVKGGKPIGNMHFICLLVNFLLL